MYSAAKLAKNNLYNKAFKESILNYLFNLYKLDRTHTYYIGEIEEYCDEYIYDEKILKLEDYAGYFDDKDNYDSNIQVELRDILYDFYINIGGKKENLIFNDKNVAEIFYESNEYRLYKNAIDNLKKAKAKLKELKSCKKIYSNI